MANSLNTSIAKLKSRYASLEQREQTSLAVLAVFVAGLFLVYGIWYPANDFYRSNLDDRDRQFELLQYMRSTEQEARTLGDASASLPGGQDLLTLVSRTASQYGITPNRLQPEGNGVSVWFDDVPFNDFARWLQAQSDAGVSIQQARIDRQEEAGLVSARILLRGT